MIRWATFNGARALNELGSFGSIECEKRPGLILLQNIDLINMKLLPETSVSRPYLDKIINTNFETFIWLRIMSTFLFDKIIFGPVKSRRLGVSLGINLLPATRKVCNFNCIYCECGWTKNTGKPVSLFPSRQEVYAALDAKLADMREKKQSPDVITYAGNGEPTLHPDFPGIIDDSIKLRDKYFPEAKITVLSNSTAIY